MAFHKITISSAEKLPVGNWVKDTGFFEKIFREMGLFQIRYSCISCPAHEEIFRSFLRGRKIKQAIEIGTFQGTATAILTRYADMVITIDNRHYNEAQRLWINACDIKKIVYYIIESEKDKAAILDKYDFDFAFLDGNHRKGIITDFELVKKCGRVLFHDYFRDVAKLPEILIQTGAKSSPWILDLVDSLPKSEVTIREPVAYWERKDGV